MIFIVACCELDCCFCNVDRCLRDLDSCLYMYEVFAVHVFIHVYEFPWKCFGPSLVPRVLFVGSCTWCALCGVLHLVCLCGVLHLVCSLDSLLGSYTKWEIASKGFVPS